MRWSPRSITALPAAPPQPGPAGGPHLDPGVIKRIERHSGIALRAAIAAPVGNLADVAAARTEVDRVLDQTTR